MALIDYYPLALLLAIVALALPRSIWWAVIGITVPRLAYDIYLWKKRPKETRVAATGAFFS
jgi:hypothetical protein